MAVDDTIEDLALDGRLAKTGASLRARPSCPDAGRFAGLARRRSRRRAVLGGTCAAVVLAGGLLLGVSSQGLDVVQSAAAPAGEAGGSPATVWFAVDAAPAGSSAHTVGDWGVIAPASFETRELAGGCGAALMDPAAPDLELDEGCVPIAVGGADAAIVFARVQAPPSDVSASSSVPAQAEPAALVASSRTEQVFVIGPSSDTVELLRSTLTSIPAGFGGEGEVFSGGARTEVPPGAPALPDYRPGVPPGFDLTSTAGSASEARFRLIDSEDARPRFVNVCVSDVAPDPGACSGGDDVELAARAQVLSAGGNWRCSSPVRCISDGPVDVAGSDRYVTINADGGLLSEAEVQQLLVWAPRP